MHKKLSRLIEPNLQPYFLCLVLFIIITAQVELLLALVETVALLLLYLVYRHQNSRRRRNVMQYIDTITGGADSISQNSLLNTPLPVVIFRSDNGEIIWANDGFVELTEVKDGVFDQKIQEVAPNIDYKGLLDGSGQAAELTEMNGRVYQIYGAASRMEGHSASIGLIVTAYFIDVTQREQLHALYDASRLVVAILVLDNYDELMRAGDEAAKSAILAKINALLVAWVDTSGSLLQKFSRDRYLLVCDESHFEHIVQEKFSILETIHQVVSEDGVAASLSIGVGRDCESYRESYRWAEKSIEMAFSRGGDQAVVKDSLDFQFYGGRGKSAEKRTKVKSRVMAGALGDLIADATQVYVMGHEYADMDAVGASAGICCAARKRGKKAQIVINLESNSSQALIHRLREQPEYAETFVSGQEAFIHAQAGALLVVVDTNRPDMVESRQLLDSCNRVAVIDHHRRASSYIEGAALNFHEPYASSASELVTELLQYMVEPGDLLRAESEALLAGIMLDTKNFIMRTGGRTFEAAAFLRRAGADTVEVRKFFQSDLSSMIQRYDIIRGAKMYRGDIAIALARKEVDRVVAAKAADDLLTLQGVEASIVLYVAGEGVSMSGRSMGEINVQLILERLGGGGNATTAGGYVPNTDMDSVYRRLISAIDEYLET